MSTLCPVFFSFYPNPVTFTYFCTLFLIIRLRAYLIQNSKGMKEYMTKKQGSLCLPTLGSLLETLIWQPSRDVVHAHTPPPPISSDPNRAIGFPNRESNGRTVFPLAGGLHLREGFHGNQPSLTDGKKRQVGCPRMDPGSSLGEEDRCGDPEQRPNKVDTASRAPAPSPQEWTILGVRLGRGGASAGVEEPPEIVCPTEQDGKALEPVSQVWITSLRFTGCVKTQPGHSV